MTTQPKKSSPLLKIIIFAFVAFVCVCVFFFVIILSSGNKTTTSNTNDNQPKNTEPAITHSLGYPTVKPPTKTPTPKLGDTRDNPFPSNSQINIGGGMLLTVLETTRPADSIVANGNMFNQTPEPGKEFIMLKLQVQCAKSSNEKCEFSKSDVYLVGSDGNVKEDERVAGIPNAMDYSIEFFGNSSIEGTIVFQVVKGDENILLYYEPYYEKPIYFQIP